ncbi:MAG: ABC transporter substrate-binding protein [Lachnospiraceae bacterium]|nr:ABC transporter substrate-binding protein [Lachnospiraceae bacterium]
MKRRILSLLFVLSIMTAVFTGCGNSDDSSSDESAKKDDNKGSVYYLNFKPEVDDQWQEIAKAYTKKTGVDVKVVTAASNQYETTLKSEMSGSNAPTLFQINGPVGYKSWKDYCLDLSDTDLYKNMQDQSMAVKGDDGKVYGIPFSVEAYGIIYNNAIMEKYFALDGAVVKKMDEIDSFDKLKEVVEDMTKKKDDLKIEGVFASTSLKPGEDWRWQTHLANLPIYYELQDKKVNDLDEITFKYGDQYKNVLDLYMDNSVSEKGLLGSTDVAASMAEFALGECAMVQNGNWAWSQISKVDGNVVKKGDIKFLPIYFGVDDKKQGLCIGTENFWCVNSKASKEDIEATKDFLNWLITDDEGKAYMYKSADEGGLGNAAPFKTFNEDERSDDPLAAEMYRWMESDKTNIPWSFTVFPSQTFKDDFGAALLEYANGNMKWKDVSKKIVEEWALEK